ncbi:MAG: methylenetetrahydromethanopterin dehydrogenase [Alphaproteobacteria bacterium]
MPSPNILHMVTPQKHVSPFDVNMALDAGYDAVVPYTLVVPQEIRGLVQDAIFSRSPSDGPRTGLFIGGRNAIVALDMLTDAWEAMVPPFAISLFADPSGSFTTGASLVAVVEQRLKEQTGTGLAGKKVLILGGGGVVSFGAAVVAAQEGAIVKLAGHDGDGRVKQAAADMRSRFNVHVTPVDASSDEKLCELISETQVLLCAASAGMRVVSMGMLAAAAEYLEIAADTNAVPPSGIAGIGLQDDAAPLVNTVAVGIGPLVIGNIKYQVQAGLFRQMIASDKAIVLDFRDAFKLATEIVRR